MQQAAPITRCSIVWLLVSGTVAAIGSWLLGDLLTIWGLATGKGVTPLVFDELLTSLAGVALASCALWFWLVTTVVVIEAMRGVSGETARRSGLGCPPALRRALLVACGLALSGAVATSAHAGPGDPQHQVRPAASLVSGLPLPDRAETQTQTQTRTQSQTQTHHTVRSGDTLWDIAAEALGPHSSDTRIMAAWHAIHESNREVIGADPDLIRPGAMLLIPDFQEEAQ